MPKEEKGEALPSVITEKVQVYPRGRGRVLVIAEKRLLPKPKTFKRKNPHLNLVRIKSNPHDFCITCYINNDDGRVRKIMYPEGRQLSVEESERLAIASLLCLTHLPPTPLVRGKGMTMKRLTVCKNPHFKISQDFRQKLDIEYRRYLKWRIRN